MYVGQDWGHCQKCDLLTPYSKNGKPTCTTCGGLDDGEARLAKENEELKQRILRLEARIAELTGAN